MEGIIMNAIYGVIVLTVLIYVLMPKKFSKSCSWWEENNIIYFFLTSNGTNGPAWIERLENQGFKISFDARCLLLSKDFKETSCVKYKVAVLKGKAFTENDRITKKISERANKYELKEPNMELACLIREKFSDKEIKAMGLNWIITMHKPIKDSSALLGAFCSDDGSWLVDSLGNPWLKDSGFAFEMSREQLPY